MESASLLLRIRQQWMLQMVFDVCIESIVWNICICNIKKNKIKSNCQNQQGVKVSAPVEYKHTFLCQGSTHASLVRCMLVLGLWVFYEFFVFLLPSVTEQTSEHCPRTCLVIDWTLVIRLPWDLFTTLPWCRYAPRDGTPVNPSAKGRISSVLAVFLLEITQSL